jgi:hypothetical protein
MYVIQEEIRVKRIHLWGVVAHVEVLDQVGGLGQLAVVGHEQGWTPDSLHLGKVLQMY